MIELVNNHLLFPEPCNWSERIAWSRQWGNEISGAVTGAESRRAVRTQPRITLSFSVIASTVVNRAVLSERILAATKSGLACAPYHGRGAVLNASASGDEITVRAGRTWLVGDYIFCRASDDSYEVRQVTAANLAADVWTLELDSALDANYPAGSFVWPLIFGKFVPDVLVARTPQVAPTRITIAEQISPASTQLGAVAPPGGSGIGTMVVGSTFVVA